MLDTNDFSQNGNSKTNLHHEKDKNIFCENIRIEEEFVMGHG